MAGEQDREDIVYSNTFKEMMSFRLLVVAEEALPLIEGHEVPFLFVRIYFEKPYIQCFIGLQNTISIQNLKSFS